MSTVRIACAMSAVPFFVIAEVSAGLAQSSLNDRMHVPATERPILRAALTYLATESLAPNLILVNPRLLPAYVADPSKWHAHRHRAADVLMDQQSQEELSAQSGLSICVERAPGKCHTGGASSVVAFARPQITDEGRVAEVSVEIHVRSDLHPTYPQARGLVLRLERTHPDAGAWKVVSVTERWIT